MCQLGAEAAGRQATGEERGEHPLFAARQRPRRDPRSMGHRSGGSRSIPRLLQVHTLTRNQLLPAPSEAVFAFFADPFNLETITPPWLRFRVVTPGPIEMRAGTLIEYRLVLHRVPIRWRGRIAVWEPGRRFVDVQVGGPYRAWHHTHAFERHAEGTLVRDSVRYVLPLGPLGRVVHAAFVRRDLERIFDFRHDAVRAYFNK
jgi:ligand-binding SRPBCC domain-containing protein